MKINDILVQMYSGLYGKNLASCPRDRDQLIILVQRLAEILRNKSDRHIAVQNQLNEILSRPGCPKCDTPAPASPPMCPACTCNVQIKKSIKYDSIILAKVENLIDNMFNKFTNMSIDFPSLNTYIINIPKVLSSNQQLFSEHIFSNKYPALNDVYGIEFEPDVDYIGKETLGMKKWMDKKILYDIMTDFFNNHVFRNVENRLKLLSLVIDIMQKTIDQVVTYFRLPKNSISISFKGGIHYRLLMREAMREFTREIEFLLINE